MSDPIGRTGALFERWSDLCYDHHRLVLLIALAWLVTLTSQLPGLVFDASDRGWLKEDHPVIVAFEAFQEQFGRDDRIVVGVAGERVFELRFLARLRELHDAIEARVPHLEVVESLVNARAVYGSEDELIVEELLEAWPPSRDELARLEAYARSNRTYENLFLSADGAFTAIHATLERFGGALSDELALSGFDSAESDGHLIQGRLDPLSAEEHEEVVRALNEIVSEYSSEDFRIYLSGSPVVNQMFSNMLVEEFVVLFSLVSLLIALLLYLIFRTPFGVVAPMTVMALSQLSTFACMAATGTPIQIPTLVLPSLLAALAIADAIHILTIYYQRLRDNDRRGAIRSAMGHAGTPVLFTTLTTAGGFLSFAGSDLRPVGELGIFTPIGVGFALIFSVTLIPAFLAAFRGNGTAGAGDRTVSGRLLTWLGLASLSHPWRVIATTLVLLALAILGLTRLILSQDLVGWMPADSDVVIATRKLESEMAGTTSCEMLVDLGEEYAFHDPSNLDRLDRMIREIEAVRQFPVTVGDTISLVDVVKEIHRALNENRPEAYRLPGRRDLVAQELLLFENSGSNALQQLVDANYSQVRVTLLVHRDDAMYYGPFLERVRQVAERYFAPDAITLTGYLVIGAGTFGELITSMIESYILVLILIIPLMMLMVRSVRAGLLAMAPNLLPILLCLGTMGLAEVPLNAMNLMIAGIAIGLVVDDTIHFLHHFRRYHAQTGSVERAVTETLRTAGRAMLFTTVVIVTAGLVNVISSIKPVADIGYLLPYIVALALAADVILMPALVSLFYRDHPVG